MEGIIRRALVVLTLGALVVGAFMGYFGYRGSMNYQDMWAKQYAIDSKKLDDCVAAAKTQPDRNACIDDMSEAYRAREPISALQQSADHEMLVGILVLLADVLVWPVFFLARWIFTGRWRRERPAAY
jgi:hypothetical protein